jgi:hypothetical protein
MTGLEAFVWCFCFLVTGITIRYTVEALAKAVRTIKNSQEEVKKNDDQNNPESN